MPEREYHVVSEPVLVKGEITENQKRLRDRLYELAPHSHKRITDAAFDLVDAIVAAPKIEEVVAMENPPLSNVFEIDGETTSLVMEELIGCAVRFLESQVPHED